MSGVSPPLSPWLLVFSSSSLFSTSFVLLFEFIFDYLLFILDYSQSPSFLDVLAADHRLPPDSSSPPMGRST
jgi:hypothetical protein